MVAIWDILYDLVFEPRNAMRAIAEQKNAGQAVIIALISIVIPILAVSFGLKDKSLAAVVPVMIGIKIVASLLVWMMGAALWSLIAEFFGGKGTAIGLFAGLGFAHLPRIFIVPLWALSALMPESSQTLLMVISVLLILFWSVNLDVIAIKEIHQLSTAKAILVMMMPMLMLGLLCFIAFVFISSSLINMPMWI